MGIPARFESYARLNAINIRFICNDFHSHASIAKARAIKKKKRGEFLLFNMEYSCNLSGFKGSALNDLVQHALIQHTYKCGECNRLNVFRAQTNLI